ncbi:fructosamine kinase family protein [Larsenimonas suaedae]|uniref:Fructosamine kinase family protein n=1 Tax=Larsenimonas suaedae TaxID=1851019 RepID=A0ABU1GVG4_9GAMM|nr:fructosamine kinase family protein [Larsenimonas suaedae]MCM2971320.1 fructosamine kinase family protein [Larsenimonas suaedae]MDR5896030.1 fructosamine kinase family protein [Larsenimonas suaedae]
MTQALNRVLDRLGLGPDAPLIPLQGGDISEVYRVDTPHGRVVIKRAAPDILRAERDGLAALAAVPTQLEIPECLELDDDVLAMTWLSPGKPSDAKTRLLGEELRHLHTRSRATTHGWATTTFAGPTPQINTSLENGADFLIEQRLRPLAERCLRENKLPKQDARKLDALFARVPGLLPNEPPCLVHGDLWHGNVFYTETGVALIDPAIHRHYAMFDLAMLALFSPTSTNFEQAYWDGPRPETWPAQCALFQLYPLLNHLLLFGQSFLGELQSKIKMLEKW